MKVARLLGRTLVVAATVVAPILALAKGPTEVHTKLAATVADPHARGMAHYNGVGHQARFNLNTHALAPGDYSLDLDGTSVASFTVNPNSGGSGGTSAALKLSTKRGTLGFDPRGHRISVSSGGIDHLWADFPASHQDAMATIDIKVAIDNTGVQTGASGEAHYRWKLGETRFSVDAQGLAPGSYDLLVGGLLEGTFVVDSSGGGGITFDTVLAGADHGDLLLTFDPRGQLVQISQQNVAVLQLQFPAQ